MSYKVVGYVVGKLENVDVMEVVLVVMCEKYGRFCVVSFDNGVVFIF